MEYFILLLASILLSNCIEEANKRLTFNKTFDPENTHYILNAEEEYKEIKNLKKMKYIRIQAHIVMNGQIIPVI